MTNEQIALMKVISYNASTGQFTWLKTRGKRKKGDIAGFADKRDGYLRIKLNGKLYLAHRMAFLCMVGVIPECVDHINCVREDNRWVNLRSVTRSQNCTNKPISKNNRIGMKGVTLYRKNGKYRASIRVNGKHISLGYYFTPEEAHAAYVEGSKRFHGEFGRSE